MAAKKKVIATVAAVATSAALLLGGTLAWQSTNQTALNEASDVINPGGRLHDDFNGENKDVYVENFADENIYARVRLEEYFEIITNYNKEGAEKPHELIGSKTTNEETGKVEYTYELFTGYANMQDGVVKAAIDINDVDAETGETKSYWSWQTGGSTVYMPTFNLNKDSLLADVNGVFNGAVGNITDKDGNQYSAEGNSKLPYVDYSLDENRTKIANEIYDGDANDIDEFTAGGYGNVELADIIANGENSAYYENYKSSIELVAGEEHTATTTLDAELISMDEWLGKVEYDENGDPANLEDLDNYWVYDEDGWVYWSAPIKPDSATGLLLDGIELNQVMDDTWYYAINVIAQFVTADDVGKSDGTGFYDVNDYYPDPSAEAEELLRAIGVFSVDEKGGEDDGEEENTLSIQFNRVFINVYSGSSIYANLGDEDVTGDVRWTVVSTTDDTITGSVAYDDEEDGYRIKVPEPGTYTVTAEYGEQTATATLAADYNWEYEVNVTDNGGNSSVSDDCFPDDVTSLNFTASRYYLDDNYNATGTENLTVTWTVVEGGGTITEDGVYTPVSLNGAFVSDPITVSATYTNSRDEEIALTSDTYYIYDNTYHTATGLSTGGSVGDDGAYLIVIPFAVNEMHTESKYECGLIAYTENDENPARITDKTLYMIPGEIYGSAEDAYEAWVAGNLTECPHYIDVEG